MTAFLLWWDGLDVVDWVGYWVATLLLGVALRVVAEA